MTKFGPNVSRVISYEDTGYDNIIYQIGSPPLAEEFNLSHELFLSKTQDYIRSKHISGWLKINEFSFDNKLSNSFYSQAADTDFNIKVTPEKSTVSPATQIHYFAESHGNSPISWNLLLNETGSATTFLENSDFFDYVSGATYGIDVIVASDGYCSDGVAVVKNTGFCDALDLNTERLNLDAETSYTFTVTGVNLGVITWDLIQNQSGSTSIVYDIGGNSTITGTSFNYTSGSYSGVDILKATDSNGSLTAIAVITVGIRSCDGSKLEFALVNGWVIKFRSTLIDQIRNKFVLGEAPELYASSRVDIVFLEVWRSLLSPLDTFANNAIGTTARPNLDQIFTDGNLLTGSRYLNSEMVDPAIEFETSRMVQIQYTVRTVKDIDYITYPFGLGAPNIYSKGPNDLEQTDVIFYNQQNNSDYPDGGLWRASCPNTVDGYSFAIPIALVHRRNKKAYDPVNNPNGAINSVSDIVSDRPDDLRYDQIEFRDVLDTRILVEHPDLGSTLDRAFENVLSRTNFTVLKGDSSNLQKGLNLTQYDQITSGSVTSPAQKIGTFNNTTTIFGDGTVTQFNLQVVDSGISNAAPLTVTIPIGSGLELASFEDTLYYASFLESETGYDVYDAVPFDPLYSSTNGFEFISNSEFVFHPAAGLGDGNLKIAVNYAVDITGTGFSNITDDIYEIKNLTTGEKYLFSYEEQENTKFDVSRSLMTSEDVEYDDYILTFTGPLSEPSNLSIQRGGNILYYYHLEITSNTRTFTVPGVLEGRYVRNINQIYSITLDAYLPIKTVVQTKSGGNPSLYTITLPNAFLLTVGNVLRIEVVLEGVCVNISKTAQKIGPYFETKTYSVSNPAISTTFDFNSIDTRVVSFNHLDINGESYIETLTPLEPMFFKETATNTFENIQLSSEPVINYPRLIGTTSLSVLANKQIEVTVSVEKILTSTDNIYIAYKTIPVQIPNLPDQLEVEVIAKTDNLYVSNRGSGGGDFSGPYPYAIYQIPSPDESYQNQLIPDFEGDNLINNLYNDSIDNRLFSAMPNEGFHKIFETSNHPFMGKTLKLSDLKYDIQGRAYYEKVDEKFKLYTFLEIDNIQWHRNMYPLLVKVIGPENIRYPLGLTMLCVFVRNVYNQSININNNPSEGFGCAVYTIKNPTVIK